MELNTYVDHVIENFTDYKSCYKEQYSQKKEFGIFEKPKWKRINIIQDVQGSIVVGGYSGIAKKQIDVLKTSYPKIKV